MAQKITEKDVISLLSALVKIRSPYFEEDAIMAFTEKWMKEKNIPVQIHEYFEDKVTKFHGKNVVGVLDSGKPGPVVYCNGHLDTVGLCEGWNYPPFDAVVHDGKMYGVGVLDMKAGCCAIMLALAAFVKNVPNFTGKIIYHLVSDEEGPFGLGTTYLINDNIHNIKEDVDVAIIAEPSAGFSGIPHPCLALGARGGYNYTIKFSGKSSHAATPEKGISALFDASKVVYELETIPKKVDEKLGKGCHCVIRMQSGGAACSVPDYAEIEVFAHVVRGEDQATLRKEIEAAIERAKIHGGYEIIFRDSPAEGFDGGFLPYCIEEGSEYVETMNKVVERVCGKKAGLTYFQSIGDFNHIGGKLGIPTILFGAEGDHFHSSDEYVYLKSTVEVAESLYEFFVELLSEENVK